MDLRWFKAGELVVSRVSRIQMMVVRIICYLQRY